MKKSISILIALAVFGACDDDDDITPIGADGDLAVFSADIFGIAPFDYISGSADINTIIGDTSFEASVSIFNDTPGSIRPWRVREGSCTNSFSVVGNSGDYPDLFVGDDGTATVDVVVNHELDPNDLHHVEFYLSPNETDPDTDVLACGDLVLQ